MAIIGHVDSWVPRIKGWAISQSDPQKSVELTLNIDGKVLARVVASDPRPDLADAGHRTTSHGFEIPLDELVGDTQLHDVSLIDSSSGLEVFRSPGRVCVHVADPILSTDRRGRDSVRELIGDFESVEQRIRRGEPLALLSTYRPAGCGPELLSALNRSLSEVGFIVVVVDTSDFIPESTPGADLWIRRENVGLDFASWNTGLELLENVRSGISELLLINDSCYGPFAPLAEIMSKVRGSDHDVVSLTDGWFGGHHLQSNFLFFKKSMMQRDILGRFFATYDFPILKSSIVRNGEIGLSKFLRSNDVSYGALFVYEQLANSFLDRVPIETARHAVTGDFRMDQVELEWLWRLRESLLVGRALNTTHAFWDLLLENGMPFVKRDLLTKNPEQSPMIRKIPALLSQYFGFEDLEPMRQDLRSRGFSPALF